MSNMHLVTGYGGTAHVTAADHGALWAAVVGSGDYVLDLGQKFVATKLSDNQICIADGEHPFMNRWALPGGFLKPNETVVLPVENGTAGLQRKDLIVARYTKSEETGIENLNLIVLSGTPAETARQRNLRHRLPTGASARDTTGR